MLRVSESRVIAVCLASTSCGRSDRRARKRRLQNSSSIGLRLKNAPKSTFAPGQPEARSTAINGRRHSNGTAARRSESSRSVRSSPATSTNCSGQSQLRRVKQPIVSAHGSKRSSRRTSTLTTPICKIHRRQAGIGTSCVRADPCDCLLRLDLDANLRVAHSRKTS
jgi:hypothetical protein